MAPRRKVGLSRLDAALNFFYQMGFKRGRVRKTIDALLKIYGGDGGWPFIEDSSYKVVLDALLEEDDQAKGLLENKVVDAPVEDETVNALVEAESVDAFIERRSVVPSLEDVDVPLEVEAESGGALIEDVDVPLEVEAESGGALIEHRSAVASLEDADVPLEDVQLLNAEHMNSDLEDALLEHANSVLEDENMVLQIDDSKSVDTEDVGVDKLCAGQDVDSSNSISLPLLKIDDSRLADIKVVGVRKLFTDQDADTANIEASQDINFRKRKPCYGWLSDDEDEVLPKAPKKLVRLCIQ